MCRADTRTASRDTMWPMKRVCLAILLLQQMVVGRADLEGSGVEENSEIIDNIRGDGIVPVLSDYDYSQFIPVHNDFTDEDDHISDDNDGLCDHPNCWTTCADTSGENNMVCSCCPVKRPVKAEDIDFSVTCSPSGAVVGFNLTNIMEFDLEDMEVILSYSKKGEESPVGSYEVEDFNEIEFSWPELCSGLNYQFCVEVTHSNMSRLDKPICQSCTPHGPPAFNPESVSVVGGLTYLEASWPAVSPQCDDLVYQVLLNDLPHEPFTDKNHHRVSYLAAGVYNVSVRAENIDGHNAEPMPSFLYTIQELTPPMDIQVIHSVINGSLQAELSWSNSFNFEETSLTRRGYFLNLYSEGQEDVPAHTEEFTWEEMEKTFRFDSFPHWNTKFSLETFFGDHTSNETELRELFSNAIELSPPEGVSVKNVVINDTLAAVIDWVPSTDIEGFEGLGMSITARNKDGAILSTVEIPYTESSSTFTLSDNLPMDTSIRLSTSAGDTLGQETEPYDLFSAVDLTAPGKMSVTHTVENDNLTVFIEWENLVNVEGYSADQEVFIDGMGTIVKLWDEENNLLRSEKVPLSENSTEFTLDGDLPWNTQYTLQTFAIDSEGEKTEAENLFSEIDLTPPDDISIEYKVIDDTLTAEIRWTHSVPYVFAGLGTTIDLWEGDTISSTTDLDHTENMISFALGTQASWNSEFSLRTTAVQAKGGQTETREVFGGFLLFPPKDISVKHSYNNGELTAIVTWVNAIEQKFDGLKTILSLVIEGERVKRSENINDERIFAYEETEATFSTATMPWNTKFMLQSAVGDNRGELSDMIYLFSGIDLDPPGDISVTPEVIDDALTAVVSWNNPNVFEDMSGPPVVIKLWDETEDGEMELIKESIIPNDQNEFEIRLDDGTPWQTKFSLHADFGVKQGIASEFINLFNQIHLTPPNITIISNDSSSMVEWNHTLELGEFLGLGTIVKLWTVDQTSGNLTLLNETYTDDTSAVFFVVDGFPQDTSITLQSYVGNHHSNQTELMGLFMPLALKQTQLNRILLIVGLTLLLIIYILATAYCLRMVKKKGTYKLKQKHETFSPGKFSESDHLLPPGAQGVIKPKLLSEDGSCATEQESLVSESSLNNLVPSTPYLGESMITLNKFNDDDDFMGNFDEDGSFIGNYDEYNEEQAQAVQNKLLVFQQMYRANGALCT